MSRKNYIEAARIIRSVDMPDEIRAELVGRFVTMFSDDNCRFSPSRFRDACEPICLICNRPASSGYVNEKAGERCVDPCHGKEQA